ncbi:hypothetical protein BDP55DRAFT_747116 [Colletotrichum godetiae]|uniref:Uncharacterized protein n=1 Tax=Colletotrichum godetiae TaxID=1209918 RepID=A0AAJ0AIP8_9PEZI|nr:uncharacterized protein BDP55DRAFT_747116 [Colletotrichum godetiae]KAK1673964.1 hypothetical protein BDP55DRAFT_747116 [Colletotrichum godetiae]
MYTIMDTWTATATTTTMTACKSVAATFFSTTAAKLSHRRRQYNTKWCDGADGNSDYDFCAVEDEEEKENENECWWEDSVTEDYDMLLEFSNEEPHKQKPPVPSITLTTTEGNVFFGNAIPQGACAHQSRESLNLQIQHAANAETYLCPGNRKQIRDDNRPWQEEEEESEDVSCRQDLPVPSIMLTTTEGNVFFGDAIPERTWCTEPRESLNLRTQYVANAETFLCPGDWRQLREAYRLWQQQEYELELEQKREQQQQEEEEESEDELLDRPLPVVDIVLTAPEGDTLTGDDIPEGKWSQKSQASRDLRKHYAATAETNLCPGKWLKIRENNRRQQAEDAVLADEKREEALCPKGSGSWRKRLTCVNARSQRRQARQQKLEEAERLWLEQKEEMEEFVACRMAKVEALERIGAARDFPAWSRKMDRQQEEGMRKLKMLREELEKVFEGDYEEQNEVEE